MHCPGLASLLAIGHEDLRVTADATVWPREAGSSPEAASTLRNQGDLPGADSRYFGALGRRGADVASLVLGN